jgi:ABC-2 type transport system ATP-binding protein
MDVIEVAGLRKQYRRLRGGSQVAVDGLDLAVPQGGVFGFLGPNGAGKTTAMRIILGVLTPDAGEVRWRGQPMNDEIRKHIGYLPEDHGQTFSPLFACLQACHRHAGDAGIDAPVGGRLGACAQR